MASAAYEGAALRDWKSESGYRWTRRALVEEAPIKNGGDFNPAAAEEP
jgi:hypothetical protein